jgi:hypothetical protein
MKPAALGNKGAITNAAEFANEATKLARRLTPYQERDAIAALIESFNQQAEDLEAILTVDPERAVGLSWRP